MLINLPFALHKTVPREIVALRDRASGDKSYSEGRCVDRTPKIPKSVSAVVAKPSKSLFHRIRAKDPFDLWTS